MQDRESTEVRHQQLWMPAQSGLEVKRLCLKSNVLGSSPACGVPSYENATICTNLHTDDNSVLTINLPQDVTS